MQSATTSLRIQRQNAAYYKGLKELKEDLSPTNPVRCVTKVLRNFLLNTKDPHMWEGMPYHVVTKSLGAGVHEVKLKPYSAKDLMSNKRNLNND